MGPTLCEAGAFTVKTPHWAAQADRPHQPAPTAFPLMFSLSDQVWPEGECQGSGGQERVCLCGLASLPLASSPC